MYNANSSIPADEFAHVGQDIDSANVITRKSISFWQDAWGRLKSDKLAMFFIVILILMILGAIIFPMISPYTISEQHLEFKNMGMFFTGDTSIHIFGTDDLGRDLWVRTWQGARVSLLIAFVAVAINTVVGIIYGGISGYFGGMIDNVLMRIVEIINGIPYLLIVILLGLVLKPGISTIIIAYCMIGWVGMARLVRGQVLQLKQQEFVIAASTMGASSARIIARHLIPNIISVIIINLTLSIPSAIFTEAFLSFLGLGVPIPNASWGMLASTGIRNFQAYPYQLLIPAFFISITMLAFNLLGDRLRDAFDPKLRR